MSAQGVWCPLCAFQLRLRAEKRKERLDEAALSKRAEDSRIGFESHKRAEEKNERAKERHKWDIWLAEAKAEHQQLQTLNLDMDRTQELIRREKQTRS
jgi:hypothetical protein